MRRCPIRAGILLTVTVLALQGCGGSVAVRSSFAGPAASPPATGGTHPGLHAKGGGTLAAVLVLGLIIADVVAWASQDSQRDDEEGPSRAAWRSLFQPIDRGWVDRGP